ncbi:MAG: hypothetical protein IT559_05910 [Alphaproteobacteria bacterium]|nr:hypothetical protein [Alphaproteobacteria bacterium]
MIKYFSALIPLLALGACAYTYDNAVQDVKFETPGAYGAICNVYVEKVKYVVKPPQTINIFKSKEVLEVDCKAPGNRERKIFIKPLVSSTSNWNIANAGVGYAWDYASGALWRYPDVIEIDFTGVPTKSSPLPGHNLSDVQAPENHLLEEFVSETPRRNADRDNQPVEIIRRQKPGAFVSPSNGADAFSETSGPIHDKGQLMDTAPPASGRANSDPAPLFPGQ